MPQPGISSLQRSASDREMPDTKPHTVQLNQVTVTMLGVSQSGKSTYILGAYAELVNGVHGCFMHTRDEDAGAALVRELNALRAGAPPPPTPDKPVQYQFVLTRTGSTEHTLIDLMDFRGGAPFDVTHGKQSDTAQLHQRLVVSDSVFVVLDSSNFRDPVTPSRLYAVRETTGAERFSDMIGKALAERQQAGSLPPSIAVLLTKADLIDGRPGSPQRDWDELEGEVRGLLRAAFQPNLATRIFPVSVGGFGASLNGQPQSVTMDLQSVGDPVIFAVGWFLRACQAEVHRDRERVLVFREKTAHRLEELTRRARIIQWFKRSRIIATQADLNQASAGVTALDTRWNELGRQSQALLSSLDSGTGANDAMGVGRLRSDRCL
jgi:hypothetical protein